MQAPSGIPAGLGQLVGDPPVPVLHNIHSCVCNPLPLRLQLAVANRSGSCIPELDWAYIFSSKMACDRDLCSDVYKHYSVFLKIAFLALLLVIAFALAFYMLFFEPDEMVCILCTPEQSDFVSVDPHDLSWVKAVTCVVLSSSVSVCCSYNFSVCETLPSEV